MTVSKSTLASAGLLFVARPLLAVVLAGLTNHWLWGYPESSLRLFIGGAVALILISWAVSLLRNWMALAETLVGSVTLASLMMFALHVRMLVESSIADMESRDWIVFSITGLIFTGGVLFFMHRNIGRGAKARRKPKSLQQPP